jgi:hypothetical protein
MGHRSAAHIMETALQAEMAQSVEEIKPKTDYGPQS